MGGRKGDVMPVPDKRMGDRKGNMVMIPGKRMGACKGPVMIIPDRRMIITSPLSYLPVCQTNRPGKLDNDANANHFC